MLQVREVKAFASVHDMILAAILSYGTTASLREVLLSAHAGRLHSDVPRVSLADQQGCCTALQPVSPLDLLCLNPTGWRLQIYQACEREGRIAYKRSGGSRLITQNDHWKSQIRHALYTCDRFIRYWPPSQWTPFHLVGGGLSTIAVCVPGCSSCIVHPLRSSMSTAQQQWNWGVLDIV